MSNDLQKKKVKQQKYIHIQGFADLNEEQTILFSLPKSQYAFKVGRQEAVTEELFSTMVADKVIHFANVFIPYSDDVIKILKEGTGRLEEVIIRDHPDKVPGGKPPVVGGGGNPPIPEPMFDFRVEIVEREKVVGFVIFKP